MGTQAMRGRRFAPLALCLTALAFAACDNNNRSRQVSSDLFVAPIVPAANSNGEGGLRTLLDKVDVLSVIDPDQLANDVRERQADARVIGHFTSDDTALVYDGQSRSIIGVNLCRTEDDCFGANADPVKLHYSATGLNDAQIAPQSGLSSTVPPIQLKNGWILAFDANTRNIIGFKPVDPVDVVDDLGTPRRLGYRASGVQDENFGNGNGLVLSVAITNEDLVEDAGANVVSRMFEIEPNRVLLFFETLKAVQLLEIEEDMVIRDWDLNVISASDYDLIPTPVIRGSIRTFLTDPSNPASPRQPFLTFRDISVQITANQDVRIDEFQPVLIPSDGSALFYDAATFNFFRVRVVRLGGEDITGSGLSRAVSRATFLETLRDAAGITNATGPFTMGSAFLHPSKTEVWIVEEETNNVLCYDYSKPDPIDPSDRATRNMDVCVPSNNFANAFDPKGNEGGSTFEPSFRPAFSDVRDTRLLFDRGRDRLLGVNYLTGNVTVVQRRSDLIAVTFDALSELTLVLPLDENNVRVFDSQSVSLLEMPLDYAAFPVRF